MTKTMDDVENYLKCTFLNECARDQSTYGQADVDGNVTQTAAEDCIQFLVENDFIKVSKL